MHMAVALDYNAWITENTALCHRLSARITDTACEDNRLASCGGKGDFRCAGCGGLRDQPETDGSIKPVLTAISGGFHSSIEEAKREERSINQDELSRALAEALQEISAGDPAGDLEALDQDDMEPGPQSLPLANAGAAELDPLTRLLMLELQSQDEEDRQEPAWVENREHPERKRRVQVYVGRCMKCAGYMIHAAKECYDGVIDDEIYRCFNCGWRISPAYDYHRKHPGEGWR